MKEAAARALTTAIGTTVARSLFPDQDPVGQQILAQDYDVTAQATVTSSGIKSSFVKPCP